MVKSPTASVERIPACRVKFCERPHYGRGWCLPHYRQWWRAQRAPTSDERLLRRFVIRIDWGTRGNCWPFNTPETRGGYRRFNYSLAHRWAYEYFVGPIPKGRTIDHLCHQPDCVNTDHLEPVTMRVNVLRGSSNPAAINARKQIAKCGHPFTLVESDGRRRCLPCYRDYRAEWARQRHQKVARG